MRRQRGVRPLWRGGGPSSVSSGYDRQADDCADHHQRDDSGGEQQLLTIAPHFFPLHLEAATALLSEKLLPILHAADGLDESPPEARLSCDGALAADGNAGAGAGALRKIFGKLCVPGTRGIGHCPPCSHPFFDSAAPIITLVRLHWVPLTLENPSTIHPNA